ncbi:MAG: hydratase [Desulfobacterales bacterium]|nr:hydratase [Desulfobacterales bacterium]
MSLNVTEGLRLIDEAGNQGARLMVLPELCNTGYIYNSHEELSAMAEPVPDGPTTEEWIKAAKKFNAYIFAGITERDGVRMYNTMAVVGPEGFVGKYRKTHLWNEEKLFFEPGNLGFPVFELPFGKVGCRICYDGCFPHVTSIYAAQGVDIICDCTNWVVAGEVQTCEKPTCAYTAQALSVLYGVFTVCADRFGTERDCTFIGASCIIAPSGDFLAGPASHNEPGVLVAEINVTDAHNSRYWTPYNNMFTDRRTDLYDAYFGYDPKTGKRVE